MLPRPDYAPLLTPTAPPRGVDPDAHAVATLAAANGWQYFTHAAAQPLPGLIFRRTNGEPRFMQMGANIVRLPGAPSIEIGNAVYLETAAGNQFSQKWGYAAVQTGAVMPLVVIEAERNREISALPSVPADAEPSRLGEPGRAVTLFTHPAAAAWAAEVFTPDVVALLDDGTVAFDVELVGGYLFLYAPGRLATAEPAVWDRVLAVTTALLARVQAAPAPQAPAGPQPSGPQVSGPQVSAAAAPSTAAEPSAPQAAPAPAAPMVPAMRSRGWAVNGKRYLWQWGIVAGSMVLIGVGFALFAPR